MTDHEKLMARVKKLLALSSSSNEHEALAALSKAQALMAEHGLTMSKLAAAELTEVTVTSTSAISNFKSYEQSILQMVQKAFGVRILVKSGSSHEYKASGGKDGWMQFRIIGFQSHVPVAEYAVSVLFRKLRQARAEYKRAAPGATSKQADAFCYAWAEAIREKVHALALNPEQQQALAERLGRTTSYRKAQAVYNCADALAAGAAAGRRESIHRPMNAGAAPAMITKG